MRREKKEEKTIQVKYKAHLQPTMSPNDPRKQGRS
jgi:hypothetical protein